MKGLSPALIALLDSNTTFFMCEFYTITLNNGTVVAYSSADVSLTYNMSAQSVSGGRVYNPLGGMRVSRDQMRTMVGTQVDQLDVSFYPDTTDTVNGNLFPFEVASGALDWAWVSVDRVFLTAWNSAGIVGTVNIFQGHVAESQIGRTVVKMTLKSPLELLNLNMPRNVYQSGCIHNLFDSGCTLSASAFTTTGVVTGPTPQPTVINSNITGPTPGYYILGYLTFTSGVLNGQTRSILSWTNTTGGIAFSFPFWQAPAIGDTFTITAGCDHQQSTCSGKFNNIIHFRGMPYVPLPETAT